MVRTRRQNANEWKADTADVTGTATRPEECEKARAANPPQQRLNANLVQTALAGEVSKYVSPDHQWGERFPGRQPSTTQLSLFETGFKRKTGQISLFEAGFKRRVPLHQSGVCC